MTFPNLRNLRVLQDAWTAQFNFRASVGQQIEGREEPLPATVEMELPWLPGNQYLWIEEASASSDCQAAPLLPTSPAFP